MERLHDGRFKVLSPAGEQYVGEAVDCRELMLHQGYKSPPGSAVATKMTPEQLQARIVELEDQVKERDATIAKLQTGSNAIAAALDAGAESAQDATGSASVNEGKAAKK